jgi:hypothetical protein
VVREGVGAGGEMTQALYAHMNNKTIKKNQYTPLIQVNKKYCFFNFRKIFLCPTYMQKQLLSHSYLVSYLTLEEHKIFWANNVV